MHPASMTPAVANAAPPLRSEENDFTSFWSHYALAKEWTRIHSECCQISLNCWNKSMMCCNNESVNDGTDGHGKKQQSTEAFASQADASNSTSANKSQGKEVVIEPNWRKKPTPASIVGVVLSSHPETFKFFVYSFVRSKFTHQVVVCRKNFPPSCKPGNWFRLLFNDEVDLDIFSFYPDAKPLRPRRVVNCNRRVITRIWDGTVNFFVQATREECTSIKSNSLEEDTYLYSCRLGTLKLSRAELMREVDEEEEQIGDTNNNAEGPKCSIPERLKLWCCPNGWNETGLETYNVTRIDARIWLSNDTETDENEHDDEGKEAPKLEDLRKSVPNLAVKRCSMSPGFSEWFSGLILSHYNTRRLTEERRMNINNFIAKLRDQLKKQLDIATLDIALFGSVDSGFGTNDCDLDLCLVNTGIDIRPSAEKSRAFLLNELEKNLQTSGEYAKVSSVLDARTPILKFEHVKTTFHGDISIENKLAVYNTQLLRLYTDFDGRVAPLGFAVKRLAKLFGINDASAGSISSYAYIVMLIHFLQRTEPPVLPFLQNEEKGESVEGWNVSFTRDIQKMKSHISNTQSLSELLRDFLHYYAYEFNPSFEVAQIRTDQLYDRTSRGDDCSRLRLFVEDPFDLSHNLTSGVRGDTIEFILKCFRSILRGLEHFDQEHFSAEKTNGELPKMDLEQFLRQFKPRRVFHISKKTGSISEKPTGKDHR